MPSIDVDRGAALLLGGLAICAGGALLVWKQARSDRARARHRAEHWPAVKRVAVGAIGGGLLLYSLRTEGKMARIAASAGSAMLVSCVNDTPIRSWKEIVKPRVLLA